MTRPIYNVENTLYEVQGSLGSGLFSTAFQNSIIQELILEMLWQRFIKDRPEYDLDGDSFVQLCAHDKYGDDGMLSTHADGFNLRYIIETAREHWDMTITSPTKSDDVPDSFPVEDWNYLKRGFRVEGSRVYATLEIQSLLKTLNWWVPNKELSERDAMIMRCNEVAFYLASHEEHVWEDLSSKMHSAMCDVFGEEAFGTYFMDREGILESRSQHYDEVRRPLTNFATRDDQDPVSFSRKFWQVREAGI
jgi:hypothetical protein